MGPRAGDALKGAIRGGKKVAGEAAEAALEQGAKHVGTDAAEEAAETAARGTSPAGAASTIAPNSTPGAVVPGKSGSFAELDAKAVVGDQLTPHHMPQAAAKFTRRGDGGALVLPHEEHVLTRTYGASGRRIAREEIGLSFREVLARDIRDIRRIGGVKYNEERGTPPTA